MDRQSVEEIGDLGAELTEKSRSIFGQSDGEIEIDELVRGKLLRTGHAKSQTVTSGTLTEILSCHIWT
jgi:hypothetical protein